MKLPLLLINFKAYKEATGDNAIRLAKICEDVSRKNKVSIAVVPQFTDIHDIAAEVKIPIFAQHIDVEPGAHTGHISVLAIKEAGAIGTLINHSERKLKLEEIEARIKLARKYNLVTVCCAPTLDDASKIIKFGPDFLAYEPPEFIGTNVSVSKAKPEVIADVANLVKESNSRVNALAGAGITNGEDVRKALELGTKGVLVAAGVVKAKDPRTVLEEFCQAVNII